MNYVFIPPSHLGTSMKLDPRLINQRNEVFTLRCSPHVLAPWETTNC